MSGCKEVKTVIKESATPIDNETKFAWSDDDYETVEEWHEYTDEELEEIQAGENAVTIEELMNAIMELGDLIGELSE